MDTLRFDETPFASFTREEDFNSRISETIRTAVGRAEIVLDADGEARRLIDFEDRTSIALGDARIVDGGWAVAFEVGGVGRLYANPDGVLPSEDTLPCVARGELRIERDEKTNSMSGDFAAEVVAMTIALEESLDRP